MNRATFCGDHTPEAAQHLERFHPDTVQEVANTVNQQAVVVVGMAQNPHVRSARKALDAAGVPYTYLEYGSYFSKWRERLAIKMWSGWPTFPQVFVNGTLVGGNSRLRTAIDSGGLEPLLQGEPSAAEEGR